MGPLFSRKRTNSLDQDPVGYEPASSHFSPSHGDFKGKSVSSSPDFSSREDPFISASQDSPQSTLYSSLRNLFSRSGRSASPHTLTSGEVKVSTEGSSLLRARQEKKSKLNKREGSFSRESSPFTPDAMRERRDMVEQLPQAAGEESFSSVGAIPEEKTSLGEKEKQTTPFYFSVEGEGTPKKTSFLRFFSAPFLEIGRVAGRFAKSFWRWSNVKEEKELAESKQAAEREKNEYLGRSKGIVSEETQAAYKKAIATLDKELQRGEECTALSITHARQKAQKFVEPVELQEEEREDAISLNHTQSLFSEKNSLSKFILDAREHKEGYTGRSAPHYPSLPKDEDLELPVSKNIFQGEEAGSFHVTPQASQPLEPIVSNEVELHKQNIVEL